MPRELTRSAYFRSPDKRPSISSAKLPVPLEIRAELYERVKLLRQRGLSYSKIRQVLSEKYGFVPSKSLISEWSRGVHHPLGSANRFVAEPNPELAYVIGVRFGDGSINRKGYNRRIRLQSVDPEFVVEFDRCLSVILRSARHALWEDNKRREVHVEARSVLLFNFLRQSFYDLQEWIEHCHQCVSAFLRGFFDSEGSVSKNGELFAWNNDTALLGYVMRLLRKYFAIETTGPHLGKRKGSEIQRRGKTYVRNSDSYYMYVRSKSIEKFMRCVGFVIRRKGERLQIAPLEQVQGKAPGVGFEPTRPEGHGLTGL